MTDPPPSPEQPVPPESVGRYKIVEALGRGAMGTVYRAHDSMLDRHVAVKVMASALLQDTGSRARFEREARIVARITHPNVVMAYDLGYHTDGSPFIAMELLSGQDLATLLQTRPPDPDDSAAIALQTLAGLAGAHDQGIVHRDVKPANIFLTDDGKVKVMDFGVARLTAAAVTATGAVVGTAHYMSPEQVGGGRVDARSDVFSVGCVLYEMLCARKPFLAEDMLGILYQIANAAPDFSLLPPAARCFKPMLQRALQKKPGRRYPTSRDFARDLQRHLLDNARSPWARHVAEVVELARTRPPAAEEDLETEEVRRSGKGPRPPTAYSPLGLLLAPTAEVTSVGTRPGLTKRLARAAGPVVRTMGVVSTTLLVAAAALWWWRPWQPVTLPPAAAPSNVAPPTAPVVPPIPPDEPPASDSDAVPPLAPASVAPASTTAPTPAAPVETRRGIEETEPVETAAPVASPASPSRSGPLPLPAASSPSERETGSDSSPEREAHVGSATPEPEVAASATSEVEPEPADPAPSPMPTLAVPPPAEVAPAATSTAEPSTPPTSVPEPPAAQPAAPAETTAPPSRTPLTVGGTRGRRFDGRTLSSRVELDFRVTPDTPSSGQRSTVTVVLRNDGVAPIQVRQVLVTIASGDDRRTDSEPGRAQVSPGQEAAVLVQTISWPSAPPWSMEVVVHTRSGETYTNTVSWP